MDEVMKLNFEIVESLVKQLVPLSINNVKIQRSITSWVSNNSIRVVLQDADPDSNIGVSTCVKLPQTTFFVTEDDRKEYKRQIEKIIRSEIEDALVRLVTLINTQNKKPEFEITKGEIYYYLSNRYTNFDVLCCTNRAEDLDMERIKCNNYFKSKERAKEVLCKLKAFLLLERYHDIYCPDYVPDWNNLYSGKYYVVYDYQINKWRWQRTCYLQASSIIYFPTMEICQKVCDKLNKEGKLP